MKNIYFDMDGTIANLYAVDNWLPLLRAFSPAPYQQAEPMVNISQLNVYCGILRRMGCNVGVISWLSKESNQEYDEVVRAAKRDWLRRYFPSCGEEVFLLSYGTPKHQVVDPHGSILFDDEERNGLAWEEAGGIWVNPKTTKIENFLKEMAGF